MTAALVWVLMVTAGPIPGHMTHTHAMGRFETKSQCEAEAKKAVNDYKARGFKTTTAFCESCPSATIK
jgi:hypothetical protein